MTASLPFLSLECETSCCAPFFDFEFPSDRHDKFLNPFAYVSIALLRCCAESSGPPPLSSCNSETTRRGVLHTSADTNSDRAIEPITSSTARIGRIANIRRPLTKPANAAGTAQRKTNRRRVTSAALHDYPRSIHVRI